MSAASEPTESAFTQALVGALSLLLLAVVAFVLYGLPARSGVEVGVLPTVIAALNGTSATLLAVGYVLIRQRRIAAHRACMVAALVCSGCFLVAYLAHHAAVGSVKFAGTGWIRTVYFAVLVPHVVLAAAIVPLVLLTVLRALRGRFERHRAIARVTLPLWLFVSASGVVVYLLLYHLPG